MGIGLPTWVITKSSPRGTIVIRMPCKQYSVVYKAVPWNEAKLIVKRVLFISTTSPRYIFTTFKLTNVYLVIHRNSNSCIACVPFNAFTLRQELPNWLVCDSFLFRAMYAPKKLITYHYIPRILQSRVRILCENKQIRSPWHACCLQLDNIKFAR